MDSQIWLAVGAAVLIVVLLCGHGDGARVERAANGALTAVLLAAAGVIALGLWVAAQLASYGYDVFAMAANGGAR